MPGARVWWGLSLGCARKPGSHRMEGQREARIDVIVPVYRDLALTRACLDSVIASGGNCELVVVDDATPEPAIAAFLDDLTAQGQITLLRNAGNQGFVRSVNRAMALHPTRDAILLNADTQVHGDWIARIRRAAYSQDRVATVTPFSNNAEIASHPHPCQSNPMPASLASMDEAFATANAGKSVAMPTAIGFCMVIRRAAWQQVGAFDEAAFGRGYGEENDFCLRATALGWQHLLACDVFVYHRGGASFGQETSIRRQAAMAILRKRYPHYEPMVQRFIRKDPAAPCRVAADLARLANSGRPKVLFVSHDRGGGTWRHMRDLAELCLEELDILTLRPAPGGFLALAWLRPGERLELHYNHRTQWEGLIAILQQLSVQRVHVHHLVDLPEQVAGLAQTLGVPMDITIHDYYAICPRITLTGTKDRYCGEPDEAGCNRCLKQWPRPTRLSIETWRKSHQTLLARAERVFVPSADALMRLRRHFPRANLILAPHPEPRLHKEGAFGRHTDDFIRRILVLGALSRIKGAEVIIGAARLAACQGLPLEFHVLGTLYRGAAAGAMKNIVLHGAYDEAEVARRIAAINPHVAWFPALWPETWSYTLSACLDQSLPIASSELGAFPERLAGKKARIRPWNSSAQDWLDCLLELANDTQASANEGGAVAAALPPLGAAMPFCYAAAYARPIGPARPGNRAALWTACVAHVGVKPPGLALRQLAFRVLIRLRSTPILSAVAGRVPSHWQTMIKCWVLGLAAAAPRNHRGS